MQRSEAYKEDRKYANNVYMTLFMRTAEMYHIIASVYVYLPYNSASSEEFIAVKGRTNH